MSEIPPTPIHFLLPLFTGFQFLDVAGPIDILNLLSLTHAPARSITLTTIASTLDPVSTKPISPQNPTTGKPTWLFPDFPSLDPSTTANTSFNQSLVPDVTYTSYLAALKQGTITTSPEPESKHLPIDVLLIPGGMGTRITRTDTTTDTTASNVGDLIDFIRAVAPRIRHSIITVCTGSDVLAQTGLLNSRRATTNMTRFDTVAARSPAVRWLKARRYVRSLPEESEKTGAGDDTRGGCNTDGPTDAPFQGEIWTSAGISAGIDVTLAWVAEYFGGVEVARRAARMLEYEWREIPEGEVDPMYGLKREDVE